MRNSTARPHILFWELACLLFLLAAFAHAQVDRAGLNGTITDPAGRALPRVHIAAIQDATGLRRTTISSSNGSYDIPELPVGVYSVIFDRDGFQQLRVGNVVQNRRAHADIKCCAESCRNSGKHRCAGHFAGIE